MNHHLLAAAVYIILLIRLNCRQPPAAVRFGTVAYLLLGKWGNAPPPTPFWILRTAWATTSRAPPPLGGNFLEYYYALLILFVHELIEVFVFD